jgi:hypothetical protein
MVYVMEGISLVTKHGAGNPYVKLIYDKQKQKTQICKHAEDASWKELFLFDVVSETAELELEVWTKSGLSDKMIGSCKVCVPPKLVPEELIDRVIDLELPSNLKSKHKEALDSRMGNVHLRMIYSCEHEVPLRPPPNSCSKFYYRNHYRNMQTGDLIVYSGVGSTDSIAKLLSGTRYSRVGMVVRLPNKWTGKEKLFVFEVTRNLGKELDAFKETPTPGASLFRLFEHIHAVSANTIWWVPLKMPLEAASCANMVDWVKEVVARRITVEFPAVPVEAVELFERYELSLQKHPLASAEICSASSIASALRLGGKRLPLDQQYMSCVQLMSQDCFGDPIIIRERSDAPLPAFFTAGPESVQRASSLALRRATIHAANGSNGGDPSNSQIAPAGAASTSASPSASDNEIVAPKMRPVSIVAEPIRATSSVAMLRQDPAAPNHTFSSQHMNLAPENGPVMNMIQPPPDQVSQYHQMATLINPPLYSPYQQPFGAQPAPADSLAQNGRSPSDIRGYRSPSNGPLPMAPPGPSILGLPVYAPGQSGSSPGEVNGLSPLSPIPGDNLEGSEESMPPSYDQATLGRGELTTSTDPASVAEEPPTKADSPSPVVGIPAREPSPTIAPAIVPAVAPSLIPTDEPTPAANPAHAHHKIPSDGSRSPSPVAAPVVAATEAELGPDQNQGLQKSPSNSSLGAGGPPPVVGPKPKPKLMHAAREKSLDKHKPPRAATAKPGSLQLLDDAAARDRAASSGAKPRLLAAPSGRNVTLPSSALHTNEDSPPTDEPPVPGAVPQISLAPVVESGGDEIISPRSKKTKRSPRESSKRSRISDQDGSTAQSSETPPEKRKKKFKRNTENGEAGSPESPSPLGQGPPPPVPDKKKKKIRSSKRPDLAPAEAIRADLDEGTKSELRKRRTGSVRILPQTEAAANWQAALDGHGLNHGSNTSHDSEADGNHPSPVLLDTFVPKHAMVLWTFDAMSENEISVTEGEQVLVLGVSEEWCLVELNGKRGAVPVSFLSLDSS